MKDGWMKKSSDDRYRPYKVSFPGKYDPYGLYGSRLTKDPRLGEAQKYKEKVYRERGFKDDDDDDDDADADVSELPFTVIELPFYGPYPTDFSPTRSLAESMLPLTVVTMPYFGPYPPYSSIRTPKANPSEWQYKKRLREAVEHEAEGLMETDCLCAEAAIKFYNQKHGTDYKIVETLGSYVSLGVGFWYHCNFRAKSSKSHPSLPKLFFAELNKTAQCHVVKVCVPLDDGYGIRSPIVRGCGMCGNHLFHPLDGFEAGRKFGFSSSSSRASRETHRIERV